MSEYLIWREGNGPDPIGDANRNGDFVKTEWPSEFALRHYLITGDNNSWFVDGYPNGEIYCVLDVDSGVISRHVVETECEPQFIFRDVP